MGVFYLASGTKEIQGQAQYACEKRGHHQHPLDGTKTFSLP